MTRSQYWRLDSGIKAIGFIGVLASAYLGFYQYHDMRERELAQFSDMKEREFYSEFWNERMRLYIKTADVAARISTAKTLEDSEKDRREFRTLFDGSMAVVQDVKVDTAIHDFAEKLEMVESGEMKHEELGIHSYHLGRVCYESLHETWDTPFSHQDGKSKNGGK